MATTKKAQKFNFRKIGGPNAADKEPGFKNYTGPKPPPDTYRVSVKRVWLDENKAGPTIRLLLEINEPKGSSKNTYNGYAIWGSQNITDQGVGFVNQLLVALANGDESIKEEFWENGVVARRDEKDVNHVIKIGDFKVDSPNTDIEMIVATKDNTYKGKTSLQPNAYIPLSEHVEETEEDSEDDLIEDDDLEVEEVGEDEGDEDESWTEGDESGDDPEDEDFLEGEEE